MYVWFVQFIRIQTTEQDTMNEWMTEREKEIEMIPLHVTVSLCLSNWNGKGHYILYCVRLCVRACEKINREYILNAQKWSGDDDKEPYENIAEMSQRLEILAVETPSNSID